MRRRALGAPRRGPVTRPPLSVHNGVARHDIDPDVFRRRAQREAWASPYPSVWLLPGATPSWEVRTYAAVRNAGAPSFATSWSAAALQGLASPPRDVPATSIPRTALQLARDRATSRRLRSYLIDAFQQRLASLRDTIELLDRVRGVPGRPRLDAVVTELVRDLVDSMLEADTRDAVRGLGYEPYARPFPLACRDGHVVHLDVAFPEVWHAIECDGAGAHMDRRSFETDRLRWSEIQRAGVTLTWVTRERLDRDLDRIAAELADVFSTADRTRPPLAPAHDCSLHP